MIGIMFFLSSLVPSKYGDVVADIGREPSGTIDVLMVGDSEVYTSTIPLRIWEQYGITSYACGTSLQPLSISSAIVDETFTRQTPRIVILETNTIFRKVEFDQNFWAYIEDTFAISTVFTRWKTLHGVDIGLASKYQHISNTKGYRHSTDICTDVDHSDYMKASEEYEPFPESNRKYVKKIQDICEENGARLVLISTPNTVTWNSKRHNTIAGLAKELGVEYIDTNMLRDEVPIDFSTDFRDAGDHLNYYGAQKFTAFLGKYLNDTGLFINHKSDGAYASWNEAADNFEKTIESLQNDF